jgi:excisionase family DNA binding protein
MKPSLTKRAAAQRGNNSYDIVTVQEAADILRVSKSYLDKKRVYGGGPPFLQYGRKITYLRSDLEAWLSRRRFTSTSEYGAAWEDEP